MYNFSNLYNKIFNKVKATNKKPILNDIVAEWLKQSDYDMDTAKYMFSGGRYAYAVFMCHLATEKAIKGLYQKKLNDIPPRTHNLIYLLTQIDIKPKKKIAKTIALLTAANVLTRYPESLEIMQKNYTKDVTSDMILKSEEVISWIKEQL